MYDPITPEDFDFLTGDDKELMQKITAYSEKVIGDVKPEDMKMSERLDKLKPIMRKLALKRGVALEDIFVRYMDLSSEVLARKAGKEKKGNIPIDFQTI